MRWALCGSLALLTIAACGDGGTSAPLPCVADLPTDCSPLYEPTYQQLYEQTLRPTCGQRGSVCHAGGGAGAVETGLIIDTAEETYRLLTAPPMGQSPRAVGGDAACSLMMIRVSSAEPAVLMPPGMPLSDAERCVIQKWIEAGAHP